MEDLANTPDYIKKDKIHLIRDIIDAISCELSSQHSDLNLTITVEHERDYLPSVYIGLNKDGKEVLMTRAYGKNLEEAYMSALTEICVCALGQYASQWVGVINQRQQI